MGLCKSFVSKKERGKQECTSLIRKTETTSAVDEVELLIREIVLSLKSYPRYVNIKVSG